MDNGKENGNYYSLVEFYWDNGKEDGNYYLGFRVQGKVFMGLGSRWQGHHGLPGDVIMLLPTFCLSLCRFPKNSENVSGILSRMSVSPRLRNPDVKLVG